VAKLFVLFGRNATMSKIGRKPIDLGSVQVEIQGSEIRYKGKNLAGSYQLPHELKAEMRDKKLVILSAGDVNSQVNQAWGLHRVLLANEIQGADKKFEKILKIVGLGFKAMVTGSKIQFSLGFSHKIDYVLPADVSGAVDKTGQILTLSSVDKESLGLVGSQIRALRPPEPYKGTGIQYATEVVRRKVGKAK